jgi:hypothetical protein
MTQTPDYKAFYKSPWGLAFMAYFVAMGLVGALTPPDILTAYSWTRPFTDFMASIVPQIDKVTALGIDADINRFYFSVMWAGSPVAVAWVFFFLWVTRHGYLMNKETAWRMPFVKFLSMTFPALLLAFLGLNFFGMDINSSSKIIRGMLQFAIVRSTITQVFVLTPVLSPSTPEKAFSISYCPGPN